MNGSIFNSTKNGVTILLQRFLALMRFRFNVVETSHCLFSINQDVEVHGHTRGFKSALSELVSLAAVYGKALSDWYCELRFRQS